MDYTALDKLKRSHPAWRLLAADHAPMVVAFLDRTFVRPNVRTLPEQALIAHLDDFLYQLRANLGEGEFPRRAAEYLETWADDAHGWLRRYYPPDTDEPHFDITSATEKAITWLTSLQQREFVGTASRLMTVFELLRQMTAGTERDPDVRIAELQGRRAELDAEIRRARDGDVEIMDPAQVKDRFQQMAATARGLLSDFRELDQNFRDLDRTVRARIATWEGGKGELLEDVLGVRDAITDSDQGTSFRAFWDLLMSPARQEELTAMLEKVFSLTAVQELAPDRRLLRVHYDWLEAGELTQRTVARVSAQLRRYLDDQAWLENRRIMQLLREVEHHALAVRDHPPEGPIMELADQAPSIDLPTERPLFSPPIKPRILDHALVRGEEQIAADILFEQVYVDKAKLQSNIRQLLRTRSQISLAQVVEKHPIERGLAELVSYLEIAANQSRTLIDDERTQSLSWTDAQHVHHKATVPLVVFSR